MSKFKYTETTVKLVMESFPGNKMQMATRLNVGIDTVQRWIEDIYHVSQWHQFRQSHTGQLCLTSIQGPALPFEVTVSNPQYYDNESMFKYDKRLKPTTTVKSVRLSALALMGDRLHAVTTPTFQEFVNYWAPVEEGKWIKDGDVRYWIGLNKTDLTWELKIKGQKEQVTSDHIQFVARISLAELTGR